MIDGHYLQYGCGWDAPDGWLNFDASPTLRIERIPALGKPLSSLLKRNSAPFPDNVRYGDIVKGLPVGNESCSGIYCSHVLEHLALYDFRSALVNTRKILRPGGIFRLVIPDLEFFIAEYKSEDSCEAALEFMHATGLGELSRTTGIKGIAQAVWGNSRHRWMWDHRSLEGELYKAGFTQIRRAEFGDSCDPKFSEVERQERWANCLGIECRSS